MPVYVGIDVHRKRSQVAVIDQDGQVLANRNVPNGAQPILNVIGGLPPGTPAAFEAGYGLTRTWCTRRGARRSPGRLGRPRVARPVWAAWRLLGCSVASHDLGRQLMGRR
jgi:hypothetical protein